MEILEKAVLEITRLGSQSWAIPMLLVLGAWTVVAVVTQMALMALPDRHPMPHYHLRMAILFALPLMLGVAWLANVALQPIALSGPVPLGWLNTMVVTVSGPAAAETAPHATETLYAMAFTLRFLAGMLMVLTLLMALIGVIRMGYQLHSLRQIRQHSARVDYPEELVRKISRKLGVTKRVEVHLHPEVAVPMTLGWRRPRIILPEKNYDDRELELILHHELVHIRRGHFLFRTMEEGVRNLFFIHPLVHFLAREITAWREMACDSELLATSETTRREYATLLYRALPESGSLVPPALSASISANPDIKKRIETMEHYPRESNKWNRRRSISLAMAVIIMIPVLMLASCDFGTTPDTEQEEVFRVIESMPEPVGGMTAIFENLSYPETARRAGIEGRVIVQFTVDEEGNIHDPEVLRGIGGGCDEAAIAAIKAVEWRVGTQRGEAVSTRFSLPITFRLDTDEGESSGSDQEGADAGAARLDVHIPAADIAAIELNGERIPLELFSKRIRAVSGAAVSSSNGRDNELVVHLSIDGSASMGTVSDVQNVLRENRIHRINYRTL
ncbi:MAG: M56 family metallopeptidase [Cyclonatronaceae bacterium]